MKKFLLTVLVVIPTITFAQKGKFIIKGQLGNLDVPAKVYLVNVETRTILDSTTLHNGTFSFKGSVDSVTAAELALNIENTGYLKSKQSTSLYLEQGVISVLDSAGKLRKATFITGTPNNNANLEFKQFEKRFEHLYNAIEKKQGNATAKQRQSEAFKNEIANIKKNTDVELLKTNTDFVRRHPNSVISLTALTELMVLGADQNLNLLFDGLTATVKNRAQGKVIASHLMAMKKSGIGAVAPDFAMADTSGNIIRLSSFRGKYVLLDIWASWCSPCREENPHLVNTYQAYKSKNFSILGVSLDVAQNKNKWLTAIQKDNLTWTQVSDLKGWDNVAAKLYGIIGIPQNFLIDPNGKIIARNLRGQDLENKLAELFDKPEKSK